MTMDSESNHSPPRRPAKRAKAEPSSNTGRRRTACQSCRLRKIKCDTKRPECSLCVTTGNNCVYLTEPQPHTLESLAETLSDQFDNVNKQLLELRATLGASRSVALRPSFSSANASPMLHKTTTLETNEDFPAPSRDFSHIPPHRTTADRVLTWPIFEEEFTSNFLIGPMLNDPDHFITDIGATPSHTEDSFTMFTATTPLEDERIPGLVDNFLQNVHTKNPILDAEGLIQRSRDAATAGLKYDAWSCIILLACALGSVAKPFGAWERLPEEEQYAEIPTPRSLLQQGENCFVLACRRLGLLKHTVLAAQCHFFAGVYLMYTMRPMLSWQHFYQASITYQLYLKTNGRLSERYEIIDFAGHHERGSISRKQSRLEQRLYWSCFKSESEFRVELPLPQSEIADYEFPKLFPTPPSPPSPAHASILSQDIPLAESHQDLFVQSPEYMANHASHRKSSFRIHAQQLCREEESWYYYLTEVALRRIGNRIINTFFTCPTGDWLNIAPYLDIAVEFEAQVSTWYSRLPPAMQRYETNSSIRMPKRQLTDGAKVDFVSRELSWATENRLLEMRSWLYQPFLYYLIHVKPPSPDPQHTEYLPSARVESAHGNLSTEASSVLWTLIVRGLECNMMILETRSLPHRHHGLWYDLRAIVTASLIILGVIKAGYYDLVPNGHTLLETVTHNATQTPTPSLATHSSSMIGGKFGKVLAQLRLWAVEAPEMGRHADVIEGLIRKIMF